MTRSRLAWVVHRAGRALQASSQPNLPTQAGHLRAHGARLATTENGTAASRPPRNHNLRFGGHRTPPCRYLVERPGSPRAQYDHRRGSRGVPNQPQEVPFHALRGRPSGRLAGLGLALADTASSPPQNTSRFRSRLSRTRLSLEPAPLRRLAELGLWLQQKLGEQSLSVNSRAYPPGRPRRPHRFGPGTHLRRVPLGVVPSNVQGGVRLPTHAPSPTFSARRSILGGQSKLRTAEQGLASSENSLVGHVPRRTQHIVEPRQLPAPFNRRPECSSRVATILLKPGPPGHSRRLLLACATKKRSIPSTAMTNARRERSFPGSACVYALNCW